MFKIRGSYVGGLDLVGQRGQKGLERSIARSSPPYLDTYLDMWIRIWIRWLQSNI